MGGMGVLAALLGQDEPSGGDYALAAESTAIEGSACRDALSHVVMGSYLSTQSGIHPGERPRAILSEGRAKVLLCQSEVARLFGLPTLAAMSCGLALDVYGNKLTSEDHSLALCQLATLAAEQSLVSAPLLQGVAKQLPHAPQLWSHVASPRMIQGLVRAGECGAASALLFQAAGEQRFRLAANELRLYHCQLLAAYQSAREAVE